MFHHARPAARSLAPLLLANLLWHASAAREIQVASREEFNAALQAAEPGDHLRIAPGAYQGGIAVTGLQGTKDRPIIIAAADPHDPPVIDGGGSGLQLSSPVHVEIRGLVFTGASGNGLNIDDGGSVETPAHDCVIRDVTIRDVGPAGNCDGIKLSGVDDFQLIGCRIERWGRGGSGIDMVGCHRGVIVQCRLDGPGGERANGVQTKGGTSEITIRQCRIEDAGGRGLNIGGSTGLAYFRPRESPYEARDITVEDCEIIGGQAAIAFVGVDGATVRHNTIYRPRTWAVRILQETVGERFVSCRRGVFAKNLVVFRSDEIRHVFNIGGNTDPESFQFTGNAWCCIDRPQETARFLDPPVSEAGGAYVPPPQFADATSGDFRLPERHPDDPGARTAPNGPPRNARAEPD